jgi:hypothetical protein
MNRRGFLDSLGSLGKVGVVSALITKAGPLLTAGTAAVEEHPAVVGYVDREPVYESALVNAAKNEDFLVRAPGEAYDEANIIVSGVKGVLIRWPLGRVYRMTSANTKVDLEYLGEMVKGTLVK